MASHPSESYQERLDAAKREYRELSRQGIDTDSLRPLIEGINDARRRRDTSALNRLLGELEREITKLSADKAESTRHTPAQTVEAPLDKRYVNKVRLTGSERQPSLEEVIADFRSIVDLSETNYRGSGFWGRTVSEKRIVNLKHPCQLIAGLQAAIDARLDHNGLYAKRVKEGLNFMLGVQQPSGFFPFPDQRLTGQKHSITIKRGLEEGLLEIKDSWVVDAKGVYAEGGSINTANCAVAMINGYRLFSDDRYLQSATKASSWILNHYPTSKNYNYNSFATGVLSATYPVSQDQALLDRSVSLTKNSILPGQVTSGRWHDPHNGLLNYHFIILRYMLELYSILPADHLERAPLSKAIHAAVSYANHHIAGRSIYTKPTNFFAEGLVALCLYAELFTAGQSTLNSINILVNSRPSIDRLRKKASGQIQAYSGMIYGLGHYIAWRKQAALNKD